MKVKLEFKIGDWVLEALPYGDDYVVLVIDKIVIRKSGIVYSGMPRGMYSGCSRVHGTKESLIIWEGLRE